MKLETKSAPRPKLQLFLLLLIKPFLPSGNSNIQASFDAVSQHQPEAPFVGTVETERKAHLTHTTETRSNHSQPHDPSSTIGEKPPWLCFHQQVLCREMCACVLPMGIAR